MIYRNAAIIIHAQFHCLRHNGALVIAVKEKDIRKFRTAAMLFLYSLQIELTKQMLQIFEDLLPRIISEPYIKWR
jgi:hypothetical protein